MHSNINISNIFFGVVIGLASIGLYNNLSQNFNQVQVEQPEEEQVLGVTGVPIAVATAAVPCSAAKDLVNRYCGTAAGPSPMVTPVPLTTIRVTPTATGTTGVGFSFRLSPQGPFTPKASGNGVGTVAKLTNDFYLYTISATFSQLMPNRTYQMWLCGVGGNCSSNASAAVFTTDSNGSGKIAQATITNNQTNNAINSIKIWQNTAAGVGDTSACVMATVNSAACLTGSYSR